MNIIQDDVESVERVSTFWRFIHDRHDRHDPTNCQVTCGQVNTHFINKLGKELIGMLGVLLIK